MSTRDLNETSIPIVVFSVLSVPATLVLFAPVPLVSVSLLAVSTLVSSSVISFIVLSTPYCLVFCLY